MSRFGIPDGGTRRLVSVGPIAALLAFACGPAGRPAEVLSARDVACSEGVDLVAACTPTGVEICFNAIDDNCNGVIDEGCGLQTGILQFTIAWSGAADVNLILETPGKERVPGGGGEAASKTCHAGPDCPGDDGCHGQNVENIYCEGEDPAPGRYTVHIVLVDLHGAYAPVPVRAGVRLGSRSIGFAVTLAPDDESRKVFSFDVP